jgi:hypothetical protein
LDKHFSKEDPKTASEHRKRCSVLRELEIKAIVRHCLTHIRRVGWLISWDFSGPEGAQIFGETSVWRACAFGWDYQVSR